MGLIARFTAVLDKLRGGMLQSAVGVQEVVGRCAVCWLLREDGRLKPVTFCSFCGELICRECKNEDRQRVTAAAIKYLKLLKGEK